MNTTRIKQAACEIDLLEAALEWFVEYGHQIDTGEDVEVSIHPRFASSCNGAKEAREVLNQMVANRLPDLISAAVENCRNTMEFHRNTIRDEAKEQSE